MNRWIVVAGALLALSPSVTHVQAQGTATTSATGLQPPPIAAFAELPFVEGPALSPDGTRLAARIAVKGEQKLMISNILTARPASARWPWAKMI